MLPLHHFLSLCLLWRRKPAVVVLVVASTIGAIASPVQAEGSRELTASGGDRPFLEYRNHLSGGILRRTVIEVYANPNETISLGSSAVGKGSGTINYRRPDGTTDTCGTTGLIGNRTQEANGTFTPCTVTVGATQGGIWEIHFISPNPNSTSDPTAASATANWTQNSNVGYVVAWDVTVRSSTGAVIPGRTFANYFAFNVGSSSRSLSSAFHVLTRDGYQYDIDLNGMDPFGFIFFSNNRGFRNSQGNPIFRSLQLTSSDAMPPGYSYQSPTSSDTNTDVTHKIFLNVPDPSLPAFAASPNGLTWLYSNPVPPELPNDFAFTGIEGTPNQAGTIPLGGNFTFTTAGIGSYSITLDVNQDGIYGNASDRILKGTTTSGSNTVYWDGRDASGSAVPASTVRYGAQLILFSGEAHFPFIDAENNPNGIIIRRVNTPIPATAPNPDPYAVYYDDRNTGNNAIDYSLCANGETGVSCSGTPPTPRSALSGISSQSGVHRFSSSFGDHRGIDTWVYYPSEPIFLNEGIALKQADLAISKSDGLATVMAGDSITYTITVTNNGLSNISGARVTDFIPAEIAGIAWTCAIASGTGRCGANSGSGNSIDTTVNLDSAAVAIYTVTGTVSIGASGTLTNTASVQRPNDVTDPDLANNTATDATTITASPYRVSPSAGQIVINEILYASGGGSNANGEFIELYNSSSLPVDLSGWRLADGNLIVNSTDGPGGFNYAFPAGTILAPGQYAVIWLGDNTPTHQAVAAAFQAHLGQTPKLNNSGEDLWLYDSQKQIVDYVAYGSNNAINTPPPATLNLWNAAYQASLTPLVAGQSISLTANGQDTNTSACWELTATGQASSRCPSHLLTRDTNATTAQTASVGVSNNEPIAAPPHITLVKRITAINGTAMSVYVDDASSANDNVPHWALPLDLSSGISTYLRGAIDGGTIQPGDVVEYTIYFLVDGGTPVTNVTICDLIPLHSLFIADAYNSLFPNANGLLGTDSGIALSFGSEPEVYMTNADDYPDRGRYFPPRTPIPASCNGSNANGAVVVNLVSAPATLPAAIGSGNPNNSHGFIRFQIRVE